MPQYDYNAQSQWRLGQVATTERFESLSRGNELLAQITTATLAASVDGIYTVTIVDAHGDLTVTGSFTASTSTASQIIVGLIADLESDPNFNNIATATDDDPALTLTFLHTGLVYTVTTTTTGSAFAVANTQDAGGTAIGLGLAVARGSADGLATAPTGAGDVLLGITFHNTVVEANSGVATAVTQFDPGDEMSIMASGSVVVQTEGAVTQSGLVYARHDVGATAFALGQLSATDDGETVLVPNARWDSSITAAGLAVVRVNLPSA